MPNTPETAETTAPTVESDVVEKSWERSFQAAQAAQQDAALQRYAEAETPGQERRALRRVERTMPQAETAKAAKAAKAPTTAVGPQKSQTKAAGQIGLRSPTSRTYSFQQYLKPLSLETKKK
jgi:hypothetical protein